MKDFNEFDPSKITGQYAPPPESSKYDTPDIGNKSRIVAVVLALFLGVIGVHNFYLGFTKKALLQLALTLIGVTSVITVIWVIADIVKIVAGTQTFVDANGKLLKG